jgi:hypothetical protein
MADTMDVDTPVAETSKPEKKGKDSSKPRFEVKKVRRSLLFFDQVLICTSGMLLHCGHGVRV